MAFTKKTLIKKLTSLSNYNKSGRFKKIQTIVFVCYFYILSLFDCYKLLSSVNKNIIYSPNRSTQGIEVSNFKSYEKVDLSNCNNNSSSNNIPNCALCLHNFCIKCMDGFYLKKIYYENSELNIETSESDTSTFINYPNIPKNINYYTTCQSCPLNMDSCTEYSDYLISLKCDNDYVNALSCEDDYKKHFINDCGLYKYPFFRYDNENNLTYTCEDCPSNCLSCIREGQIFYNPDDPIKPEPTGELICLQCDNNYSIVDNKLCTCKSGFFIDENMKCVSCKERFGISCTNCNESNCTTCLSPYCKLSIENNSNRQKCICTKEFDNRCIHFNEFDTNKLLFNNNELNSNEIVNYNINADTYCYCKDNNGICVLSCTEAYELTNILFCMKNTHVSIPQTNSFFSNFDSNGNIDLNSLGYIIVYNKPICYNDRFYSEAESKCLECSFIFPECVTCTSNGVCLEYLKSPDNNLKLISNCDHQNEVLIDYSELSMYSQISLLTSNSNISNKVCIDCRSEVPCSMYTITESNFLDESTCDVSVFLGCKKCKYFCVECNDGFFLNSSDLRCQYCSVKFENCKKCDSLKCIECEKGFKYDDTIDKCSLECNSLISNCLKCDKENKCVQCDENYLLIEGFCTDHTCGKKSINKRYANCEICTETIDTCLNCDAGFLLVKYDQLKMGNYSDELCQSKELCVESDSNQECKQCPIKDYCDGCYKVDNEKINCLKCLNGVCIQCFDGYVLVKDSSSNNVEEINSNNSPSIINNETSTTNKYVCIKCTASNCSRCRTDNIDICLECTSGHILNENNICVECRTFDYNCANCDSYNCKYCRSGFELRTVKDNSDREVSKCFDCKILYKECSNCVFSSNSMKDFNSYTSYIINNSKGQCKICQSGFTYSEELSKCISCESLYSGCLECDAKECITCLKNYILKENSTECGCYSGYVKNFGGCFSKALFFLIITLIILICLILLFFMARTLVKYITHLKDMERIRRLENNNLGNDNGLVLTEIANRNAQANTRVLNVISQNIQARERDNDARSREEIRLADINLKNAKKKVLINFKHEKICSICNFKKDKNTDKLNNSNNNIINIDLTNKVEYPNVMETENQLLCGGYVCILCKVVLDESLKSAKYSRCSQCNAFIVGYKVGEVFEDSRDIKECLGEETDNDKCVICQENSPLSIIPCSNTPYHRLHKSCLSELLNKGIEECPICRDKLTLID